MTAPDSPASAPPPPSDAERLVEYDTLTSGGCVVVGGHKVCWGPFLRRLLRDAIARLRSPTATGEDREIGRRIAAGPWLDSDTREKGDPPLLIDLIEAALAAAHARGVREGIEQAALTAFSQTSDDPQPGDWNEACEHIADTIRAQGAQEERERIEAAISAMEYDQLWGGQRRIGWDTGKEQALRALTAPKPQE